MDLKAKDIKEYTPKICPACGKVISEDPLQCDWPREIIIFYPKNGATQYWHKSEYEEEQSKRLGKFNWDAYEMRLRQIQMRKIELEKSMEE